MVHTKIGTFFVRLQGGDARRGGQKRFRARRGSPGGGFCRTRRRAYSDSSLVSSRWAFSLSVCSLLKCCLINVSRMVVTMNFLHARYWRRQRRHVNRIHGQAKATIYRLKRKLKKRRMWVRSPVSSSLCRADTGACGPSSAPSSSCRRCGRMASSRAHKTTCGTKETSSLRKQPEAAQFHVPPTRLSEGFYLMQREHSKSMGSSGSLGKLGQVFSLEGFFLEHSANPTIIRQQCSIVQSQDIRFGQGWFRKFF